MIENIRHYVPVLENMSGKYYAVAIGRQPGIYSDWSTVETMVREFPGAIYKSFKTKEEAELFLSGGSRPPSVVITQPVLSQPKPVSTSGKYYAVVSGRVPGIYTDWASTENQVRAFPGAIYKGFNNRGDAEAFIAGSTSSKQNEPIHTLPLLDKTIIYTDGSFAGGACGYGIVMLKSNGDKYTAYGKPPLPPSNNVGELYAIYVALSLVTGDVILYSDSRYSIDCLTTRIHDWMRTGWTGVANRNIIEGAFAKMQGRNVILQYVPAHTGLEFNEEADRLANLGRMTNEGLVLMKNGERILT
jgi:ribonuclease HI